MTGDIAIITPVLDDWTALERLLDEIARVRLPSLARFQVLVIDDGSRLPSEGLAYPLGGSIRSVEIVRLAVNLGHQRAIATGLSLLAEREGDISTVLIIDGDGEDRPSDISTLVISAVQRPTHCVLARRVRRSESASFRLGYVFYKTAFRILTGKRIDFGNFCLLPMNAVKRLVRMPELWNHLPAAIIRSRLPTWAIPVARGHRYAGRSRMNFANLILHGLSALSVFADLVFVRVLVGAGGASVLAALAMLSVTAIRSFTNLAIPGWASTVFGDLAILLTMSMVTVLTTTMILLANRSQKLTVPLIDAPSFVVERSALMPASTAVLAAA